jgi:hypothetical protein
VMMLSLLGGVFSVKRLDGYKGKADPATGKTSKEFKAAVRDAERDYFDGLRQEGLLKLPKHANGDEAAMQEFLSTIRDDKNYSNAKNTVSRYFAIVGSLNVTPTGYLVPVPFMQAAIENVLKDHRQPTEAETYSGKVQAIVDELAKETNPSIEDIKRAEGIAKLLHATLKGIVDHVAAVATSEGVPDAAAAAIETAKGKAPAKAAQKDTAPA